MYPPLNIAQESTSMASSSRKSKPDHLTEKFLRRLYERAALLRVTGEVRNQRLKLNSSVAHFKNTHINERRKFVNGIAYLCSLKRDGEFVTAAALQRVPHGIIVWLAANGGVESSAIGLAKRVLKWLEVLSCANHDTEDLERKQVFEKISGDAIRCLHPRLSYYAQKVFNHVEICLPLVRDFRKQVSASLETSLSQEGNVSLNRTTNRVGDMGTRLSRLEDWLQEVSSVNHMESRNFEPSIIDKLVRLCHKERHLEPFDLLKRLSAQGQTRCTQFEKLYDFMCKIGKPVSVCNALIDATITLRQDFASGFEVRTVPPAKIGKIPFVERKCKIGDLLNRAFGNHESQRDQFYERLRFILGDEREVQAVLCKKLRDETRVHAELLLIDHFERNGGNFIDGDKYIGCSKPACYLCYHYITNHPSRYTAPSSHQKLYLAWRVPDSHANEAKHVEVQRKIMVKMIERLREDLIKEITSQDQPLPCHADSTLGLTTTLPTSSRSSILEQSLDHDEQNSSPATTFASPTEDEPASLEPDAVTCDSSDDEGGVQL